MTTHKEVLELALKCAERCENIDGMYSWGDTITAIKEALAQPEQEPDYWLGYGLQAYTDKPFEGATPLYTTPPQNKELEQAPVAHLPLKALEQLKPPMLILNNVPIYGYSAEGTVAVYTTPPQRKPLTEDEAVFAVSFVLPVTSTGGQTQYLQIQHKYALEITRAIEAAHGIKENT